MNRTELEFLALTNCEVTSLADARTEERDFMRLPKRHIRHAYPA